MARIAIVGDSTSVAGFRPLGFAMFPVERAEEARDLWPELVGGEYGVVFVTEPVYAAVEDLAAEVARPADSRGDDHSREPAVPAALVRAKIESRDRARARHQRC